MRTGSFTVPNQAFFPASFSGAVAVQLRVRISSNNVTNPPNSANGLAGPFSVSAGQAAGASVILLAKRADDPQPDVILGDEVIPIDPKAGSYFISVLTSAPGGSFLQTVLPGVVPTVYLDYRAFESVEELARFATGTARDTYGNARVASYKRWRALATYTAQNMSAAGVPASLLDVGECTEFQVIQESGNGTAAGTLSIKCVGPNTGVVSAGPVVASGNYGTPALNGSQVIIYVEGVGSPPLPPIVQLSGTAVTNGTSVSLTVLGR